VGIVTADFSADLQHALQFVQELEDLVAEYKLRKAIMQREIALVYDNGAKIEFFGREF
jgi:hypothetical protein